MGYRFDLANCEQSGGQLKRDHLKGQQASSDTASYAVCHQTDTAMERLGVIWLTIKACLFILPIRASMASSQTTDGGSVTKLQLPSQH